MRSVLSVHWKDWCWRWNSNTLATWWEKLTHLKRPWYWEKLKVGGEGDKRGWDGWTASLTQWIWVRVNSGSWWWTGRPAMLQPMGSQRVRHDWVTELSWDQRLWKHFLRSQSPSFIYFNDEEISPLVHVFNIQDMPCMPPVNWVWYLW